VTGTVTAPADELLLAVDRVSLGYGGRTVLAGVSFSVRAGELIALCGPNGAGKSTLLRVLVGLHAVTSGSVALGGAALVALDRRQVARRAALLPQDTPGELPLSVRETVALGRLPHLGRFQPETDADVAAVAAALQATDVADLAERPVAELSGGERQRVHLARALAQQAPLLLLDEPIAGLDLAHQLRALELLRDTAGAGRAVLVAVHDLTLAARFCDRMLLVAGGELRADAAPAEVLTADNLSRCFGVRADIRFDAAGRPLVVPIEAMP
jgi:iron complex transport system ATP-binding protein